MKNRRYTYEIIINPDKKKISKKCFDKDSFFYDYGHTKNIELEIYEHSCAVIKVDMTVKKDASTLLMKNYLFKDALRKVFIVYLLINNTSLDVDSITVAVYDNKIKKKSNKKNNPIDIYRYNKNTKPIVYSMIQGELKHDIKGIWSKEEIENMLNIKKSDEDRREAALISYLNSKSKEYESERFLYLWMAFNGMYGYLRGIVAKETGKKNFGKTETDQIVILQDFIIYENKLDIKSGRVVRNHAAKIANKIKPIIRKAYPTNSELTKESLENGIHKALFQKIEKAIRNYYNTLSKDQKNNNKELLNLTGYTYLLTQFTYYFRCDYVHASKPIPLFLFAEDPDLIYLRIMNDILEEFLEHNLHAWFSNAKKNEVKMFAKKYKK